MGSGGGGGIKFVLLVNKQGQTRLAKYTDASMSVEERRALEGEIVRKCLARSEKQVNLYPFNISYVSQVLQSLHGLQQSGVCWRARSYGNVLRV